MAESPQVANRPVIVAHRGWWKSPGLVENSTAAFAKAAGGGFPAECDVWPSADGEPVVIHDETLERTTTGRGTVGAHRAGQLKAVRLREPEAGAAVPLLKDVADLVSYVEVKAPDAPQFVRRVLQIMAGQRWLLQSFDERNLVHARAIDPSVHVALLAEDAGGIEAAVAGGWTIHLEHRLLDEPTMHRLRSRGLRVGVWTVNEGADLVRMIQLRADVIITDEPAAARKLLDEPLPRDKQTSFR